MTEPSRGARLRIELRAFEPKTATREDWTAYHAYARRRASEETPGEPTLTDEALERNMKTDWPLTRARRTLAVVDGEIVGQLSIWTRRETADDAAAHARFVEAAIGVAKSQRRQGIAMSLLRELATLLHAEGRELVTATVLSGDGTAFLGSFGAREHQRDIENRLNLTEMDHALLAPWEALAAQEQGLTWEIHPGRVPLDRYEALIPQLTTLLNDVPQGAVERPPLRFDLPQIKAWYADMDAHGGEHLQVLLMSGDAIVATSQLTWYPDFPDRAWQALTGVARPWRGRGMAKAVKARLLRLVMERQPQVRLIRTENAGENAPMLAINHRLGFKQYRVWCKYQITRDAVDAALARRSAER